MKSTPITIYTGLAWIDEEYIDIETDGAALDLASYDLQMQMLDVDDDYAVLAQPTIAKDNSTTGRIWPSMTAAQTAAVFGKKAVWVLLLRPTDLSQQPRLVGYGRVDTNRGATWQ